MLSRCTFFLENTLSVVTLREFGIGFEYVKWRHILKYSDMRSSCGWQVPGEVRELWGMRVGLAEEYTEWVEV